MIYIGLQVKPQNDSQVNVRSKLEATSKTMLGPRPGDSQVKVKVKVKTNESQNSLG